MGQTFERSRSTRRAVLRAAASLAGLALAPAALAQRGPGPAAAAAAAPAPAGTRLVMLGTRGGPTIDLERGETASAVVVDGVPYLVDCGYGTLRTLAAAGISHLSLDTLFFTHLHDDHTADLAALLSHQWTGSKSTPTNVHGPYGTAAMVAAAIEFFRANVEIRTIDEGRTAKPEALFHGFDHDVADKPVRVLADERVVVTAATNTHFPERAVARMRHRSFGYRFETATRTIAFSGDTAYSANVVELARGADVFVCEVLDHGVYVQQMERARQAAEAGNPDSIFRHVAETHSTPADVGRMASEAGVKTVVLNHQVRGAAAGRLGFPISAYLDGVRSTFDGEVIVGEDRMVL